MLVLFFLTAGFAKGVAGKVTSHHTKEKEQSLLKYVLSPEEDKESSLSLLDQLSGADDNDVEIAFFGNYFSSKVFIPTASKAGFAPVTLCKDACTVPLYDLYCNWKLAIS
ncbi:MAG: hypothetical protein V4581_04580 [Bacteroidota bacterium]